MRRFFLPPEQCQGETLVLQGSEAHHGLRVLRVIEGDQITVLDGKGQDFLCEIVSTGKERIHLRMIRARSHPESASSITLLQAVPRGKLIESIIQKATELGVRRIVPLLTERVVHRFDTKEIAAKRDRWQQVAIEAIKQCGGPWLPRVEAPLTPEEFLARNETFELPLLASLQAADHPRIHFDAVRAKHGRHPASVCIWIGPEGDFTAQEIQAVQASGALPITLGPLVLRTETAAIYCLSVTQYEISR
jgi:16S rRNA (uracil1498-N3)-methyltransferase